MNVKKTPVSMLQEMMQKKESPPNYELIHDGGGTHQNIFSYKVTCIGLSATGTGRNKKDAKHEAATKMLEAIAEHNALPQLPASPCETPVRTPLPREIPTRPKSPVNQPFRNTIGELQDICSVNNLDNPLYEETKDIGPAHARVFTIRCTVSTFIEEGTATTKKQAKHEAARKMIEKIGDVVSDDLVIHTASEKEDNAEEILKRIAQLKYPELSVLHGDIMKSKTNWGLKVIDFCNNLKNRFEGELRNKIIIKLEELMTLIDQTKHESLSDLSLRIIKDEFKNILESLDLEFRTINYVSAEESVFIVSIQISTAPNIQEVGIGQSEVEAEYIAIEKAVSTLLFFLN